MPSPNSARRVLLKLIKSPDATAGDGKIKQLVAESRVVTNSVVVAGLTSQPVRVISVVVQDCVPVLPDAMTVKQSTTCEVITVCEQELVDAELVIVLVS